MHWEGIGGTRCLQKKRILPSTLVSTRRTGPLPPNKTVLPLKYRLGRNRQETLKFSVSMTAFISVREIKLVEDDWAPSTRRFLDVSTLQRDNSLRGSSVHHGAFSSLYPTQMQVQQSKMSPDVSKCAVGDKTGSG